MQKINFTTDMKAAASSELVVEAVIENLQLKRKLFKDLEEVSLYFYSYNLAFF